MIAGRGSIKRRKRLLLIEDDAGYRRSLCRFLSSTYVVIEAGSYEEAIACLNTDEAPDLILTDIRLDVNDSENRDGLRILEELRARNIAAPAIAMTAYGSTQTIVSQTGIGRVDALRLGAQDLLSKPLNLDELEDRLYDLLQSRRITWRQRAARMIRSWGPPAVVFALFIMIWESSVRLLDVPVYLIPKPSLVWSTIVDQFGSLMKDTGVTLLEAFLGFLLANVLSMIIAVGFAHSKWFERSFYPYTIALKSVPVIAIAPLLVLWFGYGMFGKVVMAAIISFFPLVVNATVGLRAVDPEALDLMHSLSASRRQILTKLRFPTALPFIFSALKISSALAVVGAIVAELTGAKQGIGFTILIATFNVDTPKLFAAIVVASLAGILFFAAVTWMERIVLRTHGSSLN